MAGVTKVSDSLSMRFCPPARRKMAMPPIRFLQVPVPSYGVHFFISISSSRLSIAVSGVRYRHLIFPWHRL